MDEIGEHFKDCHNIQDEKIRSLATFVAAGMEVKFQRHGKHELGKRLGRVKKSSKRTLKLFPRMICTRKLKEVPFIKKSDHYRKSSLERKPMGSRLNM